MRKLPRSAILVLLVVLLGTGTAYPQAKPIADRIKEGCDLYYQADFERAVILLQAIFLGAEPIPPLDEKRARECLASVYADLDMAEEARNQFFLILRDLDSTYRVDQSVKPIVFDLFEEVRKRYFEYAPKPPVVLDYVIPSLAYTDEPLAYRVRVDDPRKVREVVLHYSAGGDATGSVPFSGPINGSYELNLPPTVFASKTAAVAVEVVTRVGKNKTVPESGAPPLEIEFREKEKRAKLVDWIQMTYDAVNQQIVVMIMPAAAARVISGSLSVRLSKEGTYSRTPLSADPTTNVLVGRFPSAVGQYASLWFYVEFELPGGVKVYAHADPGSPEAVRQDNLYSLNPVSIKSRRGAGESID
jgi:hypothetical protein